MTIRLAATLAVVGILGACGRSGPTGHVMSGQFSVHGVYPNAAGLPPGAACSAADIGYADIHPGTPVTVRARDIIAVARAKLGRGALRVSSGAFGQDCVYTFSVRVPDAASYDVQVGTRGSTTFSRGELARRDWRAEMFIGNYAPGI